MVVSLVIISIWLEMVIDGLVNGLGGLVASWAMDACVVGTSFPEFDSRRKHFRNM